MCANSTAAATSTADNATDDDDATVNATDSSAVVNNKNDDDDEEEEEERSPTMRWGNPSYIPPKPLGTSPPRTSSSSSSSSVTTTAAAASTAASSAANRSTDTPAAAAEVAAVPEGLSGWKATAMTSTTESSQEEASVVANLLHVDDSSLMRFVFCIQQSLCIFFQFRCRRRSVVYLPP